MNTTLEKIDNELIFDIEHIIMNYVKMNNFKSDCLKDTNIQISQNIFTNLNNSEYISNSNKFATNYFLELSKKDNIIDLFSPLITNYPNSEFGLFLTVLLKKHVIDISNNLNMSSELFQKYKNDILSIYHKVLPQQKKSKLLENLCASITVLIIIGFQGNWTCGIDQLINAAKLEKGNIESNLITALILSNIEDIYLKIAEKLDNKSSKFILSLIDSYSCVVNDYINYLITNFFSGEKQNFVNGDLFKAFIDILHCFKYYKIDIIKIHGFLEFIINCISFIDINQDFIVKICDLLDNVFKSNNTSLKYDFENNFNSKDFIKFITEIQKNEDFQEIAKCIQLIKNVKNFYSNKNINEIKDNPKDLQILFASCNIFNSICENYGYIFILPEIDILVQEIYSYFINLPIYKINIILLSSLIDLQSLSQNSYKFENYDINIRENKKKELNNFLYFIQNSVLENMKLTDEELKSFKINESNINIIDYSLNLDKYINLLLIDNINDDEKNNFIESSDAFYNNIYTIISNLFDINDYSNKLCQFLVSSIETLDFSTIYCLMNIFNKLSFEIITTNPNIIFNMIDFIFKKKELFKSQRFILQFLKLLYKESIQISKNQTCLYLIVENLINSNIIKDLNCQKLNEINIIVIHQLILYSHQNYKLRLEEETTKDLNNNEKECLNNIFNIISKFLYDNLHSLTYEFLFKLISAFYNSLFYNILAKINNIDSIYSVTQVLIKEANKIFDNNNNNNDNILKYIYILLSIIKNVGKEQKDVLFKLFNAIDSSSNSSQTYLMNIQNNILKIINSNNIGNYTNIIFDGIILLNNTLITILKGKSIEYYDYFNKIITLLLSSNSKYVKVYSLTYNLYYQIFNFDQNSEICNNINQIGFDILNSINTLYNQIKDENEKIFLANKQTEFLVLYIQKSTHFTNNLNKEIFAESINNIISVFEKSNEKDFSINYMNLIKILIDISSTNNSFQNILKDNFLEKILKTIISHIKYFDKYYICIQNCFYVFKNCIGNTFEEKFYLALNEVYNDKELIELIIKFIVFIKNNTTAKTTYINKKVREFIKDLSELYYAMNKTRNEFIKKYENEINNFGKYNEELMKTIKVNPNTEIYMDLYAQ